MTAEFNKPSLSIAEQIVLLEKRGLQIPDKEHATLSLERIGYYRLSAYGIPFQLPKTATGEHRFKDGIAFSDILRVYQFDKNL